MRALELRSVTRRFGALAAVDEVDLELDAGEVCGLVGPNGSGKTTLINLVSGLLPVSSGTIHHRGDDVTTAGAHEMARRSVRRTFQLIRLVDKATAMENVLAGLYTTAPDRGLVRALLPFTSKAERAAQRTRAMEALAVAGVDDVADEVVSDLPFGIQRRVELARAVVARPEVLLLDEPAAGITSADIVALGSVIRTQAEAGCSVLLVDHHLSFVLDVCPRLVVMNFGRKIFDGPSAVAIDDRAVREAYVGV